jgi:hypothetical protein
LEGTQVRKDRYIVFANLSEAEQFVETLDAQIGEHWADPIPHPFDDRAALPWNDKYLSKVSELLEERASLSVHDIRKEGWNLGYHQGRFAKASAKLEDALCGRDALELFNEYPNFPAFRSVFYGVLTALYGVKEALRKTTSKLGSDATDWWESEFQKIKADPTLSLFYEMHNSDKHSLDDSILHPTTKFFGYRGPAPQSISGEGVFWVVEEGTKDERRAFLPGAKATFECYLVTPSGISDVPAKTQLDQVLEHYKQLVWTAKKRFGDS